MTITPISHPIYTHIAQRWVSSGWCSGRREVAYLILRCGLAT